MLRKLLILSVLLFTFIFASAAAATEQIRIGIVVGQATAELSCEDEFTVRDSLGKTTTMPKGKYFIHAQQGKLFFDDNNVFGNEAVVAAVAGKSSPQINKRSYKGDFQLQADQGNKLLVVNRLPLEDYLASVLPAKTMSVWPDEVIKAQAVAAHAHLLRAHGDVLQTVRVAKRQSEVSAYDTRFLLRAGKLVVRQAAQLDVPRIVQDAGELFHRLHELHRRFPVLYLLRDDMPTAQRAPVTLPPHALFCRLGQEQVAPVAQIRTLVEVHSVAPCQKARTFLLPVGAIQLLYIPVLLVQHRIVGLHLDCLAPRGMDTLVFLRRHCIDPRQFHLEGCGDVRVLRDDAPVFHRQQREAALQRGGFHYVSHAFPPFFFRLCILHTRLRWSR